MMGPNPLDPPLPSSPQSQFSSSPLPPDPSSPLLSSLSGLDYSTLTTLLDDDGDTTPLLTDLDRDTSTRDGQTPTGTAPLDDDIIDLSPASLSLLELQIDQFLGDYQSAVASRHEVEQEIRDAYELIGNNQSTGGFADGASLVSGSLRRLCAQFAARLNRNFDTVTPHLVVDPVEGAPFSSPIDMDFARATQSFLLNYLEREIKIKKIRPLVNLRAVKVGTCVLHVDWEERTERVPYYDTEGSYRLREERKGAVKLRMIDNRHMVLWPITITDWEDYEWVGHRVFLTKSQWAIKARDLDLPTDLVTLIDNTPGGPDEVAVDEAERFSVDAFTLSTDSSTYHTPVEIVELWGNMILPGDDLPTKFQLFFHPGTRKILGPVTRNRLFSQSTPYCPIRLDWNDSFAFGTGIGHELLSYWSADSAMRNFRMDQIRASFPVILRDAGSMFNVDAQSPRPGMQIPVNDTQKDFVTRHLGGETPGLDMAIQDNLNEARETASFAPVLSGLGDPTQKSGTGTGATLALIEQGGMRLAQIDTYLREDWSLVYAKILELVTQFAPDGVYYQYSDQASASQLKYMKYSPPRGRISDLFRIRAMAPSAGTSSESRKQNYLILWKFASESVMFLQQTFGQAAAQDNPEGFKRWNAEAGKFLEGIMKRVIEFNELPGIMDLVPELPELTPQDQVINQLTAELQNTQAQLQQMGAQLQQMGGMGEMGGGQNGMSPEMPGGGEMGGAPGGASPEFAPTPPQQGGF